MKMLELVLDVVPTALLWAVMYFVGIDGVMKGMVNAFHLPPPRGLDYVALGYVLSMLLYIAPGLYLVAKIVKK